VVPLGEELGEDVVEVGEDEVAVPQDCSRSMVITPFELAPEMANTIEAEGKI